jgi:hypothetical protein
MLDPNSDGSFLIVEVTGGAQGGVSLTPPMGKTKPAIKLGEWYKPLEELYVPDRFDAQAYAEALEEAKSISGIGSSNEVSSSFEKTSNELPQIIKEGSKTFVAFNGSKIEMPERVEKAKCFGDIDESNPDCITCPINAPCEVISS